MYRSDPRLPHTLPETHKPWSSEVAIASASARTAGGSDPAQNGCCNMSLCTEITLW